MIRERVNTAPVHWALLVWTDFLVTENTLWPRVAMTRKGFPTLEERVKTWTAILIVLLALIFLALMIGEDPSEETSSKTTTDTSFHYDREMAQNELKERASPPIRASRARSLDAAASADTTTSSTPTTHVHPPKNSTSQKHTTTARSTNKPAGDIWAALANCESTMDQRATSASGKYLGYFQFSMATWKSVGGPGDPRDHDYETQLKYAKILQARSGWGQWPSCSRKLGLL